MKRSGNRHMIVLAIGFLILVGLACGPTGGGALSIAITSPASGSTVTVGQEVQVVSTAVADDGIARVELLVNGQVVRSDFPPSGNPTTFSISQSWTPVAEGQVTISTIAYDVNNAPSDPAVISLQVAASAGGTQATPGPTSTPVPDVTTEAGCSLNASYVADVTVPDDTQFAPGTAFVKTWRIRNSGTCDWSAGFNLVFVGGDQMGGQATVPVPAMAAGSTTDVSVNLTAPSTPGTYRGNWRMQSDTGLAFGSQVYCQIIVPAPTSTPTEEPTEAPTEEPTEEPTTEAAPVEIDIVADQDAFWWPQNMLCMLDGCPDFAGDAELSLVNSSSGGGGGGLEILYQGMIALHFDLSGIPAGATIEQATLYFYLASAEGGGSVSLSARRATSPWSEADHAVKPICDSAGGISRAVGSGSGWYDWNVTDIVEQQYTSATTNYGLCIRGGTPSDVRVFRSREGSAVTRPYLRVVYHP